MISATHSHTGPVILEEDSPGKLEDEMLATARNYAVGLPEKIVESVLRIQFFNKFPDIPRPCYNNLYRVFRL